MKPNPYRVLLAGMSLCAALPCAADAPEWENPAVNSRNRLPPRTYAMPLADESAALTDALEPVHYSPLSLISLTYHNTTQKE